MKTIAVILFGIVLAGCVTTKGVTDSERRTGEPWHFSRIGSAVSTLSDLRRFLFEQGWPIRTYDTTAGLLDTDPKGLLDDERIDIRFIATSGMQWGRVSFVVSGSETTDVRMRTFLSAEISATRKSDGSFQDEPIAQGHPLPMKLMLGLKARGYSVW